MLLGIGHDTLTCKIYNVPLVMRFPVLLHCFAVFSSRQMAQQCFRANIELTPVSLYHHNIIVKAVNVKISQPKANYNSILLGMQGALASTFASGNQVEFGIHRRGQSAFLRAYGLPQDFDVMLHLVANSLMFGKAPVEALLEIYGDAVGYSPSRQHEVDDFRHSCEEVVALLLQIQERIQKLPASQSAIKWTRSQLRLFQEPSILHYIIRSSVLDHESSNHCWRATFEIAHHPFLVLYLSLLISDTETLPLYQQEMLYGSIIKCIHSSKISKQSGSVPVNWMLLTQFKDQPQRTWKAQQLLYVLLRLSQDSLQLVLRLLLWRMSPWNNVPHATKEMILGIGEEALTGL